MKKTNTILAGVLAVQCVLALVTWSGRSADATAPEDRAPVLDFDPKQVDSVLLSGLPRVNDTEAESVELRRDGEQWLLASAADYPCNERKVGRFLERMAALRAGEVIARNKANHDALKVGEESFDRLLTLSFGEETKRVYIGNGPRNSVHVRLGDKDEVRAVRGMTAWNLRVDPSAYIDTGILGVDKEAITSLRIENEHGDLNFARAGDAWRFNELPEGRQLHELALESFLNVLTRMEMNRPIARGEAPNHGLGSSAVVELGIKDDDGSSTVVLKIGKPAASGGFYAKADNSEFVVTVPKAPVEQVTTREVQHFLYPDKG